MSAQEVLLLLGHISQVAIWNCPILRTARSQMSSPPHLACLSTGQKAALSLVHCALGHRAFHGWPIMVPSSPSGPSLHSAAFPSQCKTLPTPTGLEDKYFPGKRHKWRGLGHCKVGRFQQKKYQQQTHDGRRLSKYLKFQACLASNCRLDDNHIIPSPKTRPLNLTA